MQIGIDLVHASPRRAEIERRMDEQEAQWQRLQQQVFRQYGN